MFDLKPIVFDQGDNASYQMNLTLLVKADGSVKCVQLPEDESDAYSVHYPDDAIRAAIGQWRYEPYHDGGKAIPFSVSETVLVTHAPLKPVPMPQGSSADSAVTPGTHRLLRHLPGLQGHPSRRRQGRVFRHPVCRRHQRPRLQGLPCRRGRPVRPVAQG
ncbi:MAG: hypothetical protein WDN06_15760 [Asticcacaulis sp.]